MPDVSHLTDAQRRELSDMCYDAAASRQARSWILRELFCAVVRSTSDMQALLAENAALKAQIAGR